MKSGKNLGIAYSVKKKAKGGRVEKGVHTKTPYQLSGKSHGDDIPSAPKQLRETEREGMSAAGHEARLGLTASAKKRHAQVLEESRSMPKPNLPMAEGGMIDKKAATTAQRGPKTIPLKHPSMQQSPVFRTKLRDQEDDLEMLAEGGSIDSDEKRRHHMEKGVHKPAEEQPALNSKYGKSEQFRRSTSHDLMRDNDDDDYAGNMRRNQSAKDQHHKVLGEMVAGPKPKLKGLAEGGEISDIDGGAEESMDHEDSMADAIMARRDRLHEEIDSGAHDLDSAVKMAEGGEAHSGAYHAELGRIRQSEKAARETGASQRTGELHTPEQERALREKHYGKRQKLAEGGEVDIDENAEEQPNEFYDLNEDAALKENYDSDMDDVSQPKDSNEHGHILSDEDEHDMVDKIRSGMKKRQR